MGYVALVLFLILVAVGWALWSSLRYSNDVLNFFLLMLLSETNYRVHSDALLNLVISDKDAASPLNLLIMVTMVFRRLVDDAGSLPTKKKLAAKLWELKTALKQPATATGPPTSD